MVLGGGGSSATPALDAVLVEGNTTGGTDVVVSAGDAVLFTENAAVPWTPAAGLGTYWVRDDAPNVPVFTDDAGADNVLAYVGATVTVPATLAYAVSGDLAVDTNVAFPLRPHVTFTITGVDVEVKTAPTGANIIVDVNVEGSTIFADPSDRPEIVATEFTASGGDLGTTTISADEAVTIDVDQIGSTIAGADLVVMLRGTVQGTV